jgi:hypothetical protein
MYTARTDLSEAVDGAKLDVRSRVRDGTQLRIAPANETSGIARSSTPANRAPSGEAAAIAKTQQLLDALPAASSPLGTAPVDTTIGATAAPRPQSAAPSASARTPATSAPISASESIAPLASSGIAADAKSARKERRLRGDNGVSRSDLHRLRGDVHGLSAHVSALQRELALVRAALEGASSAASLAADPPEAVERGRGGAS